MKISLASLVVALMFSLGARAESPPALDIGLQRQLFVDHYLIDHLDHTELRLQHPRDEGTVLEFDAPWEGKFCAYITVIHVGDKYQMYYRGAGGENPQYTCYAESADGIHWQKPALSLCPTAPAGSNVVIADAGRVTHNFSPFFDTNPNSKPGEQYKGIGGYDDIGLLAYVSSDGVSWHKLRDKPVLTHGEVMATQLAFDSQNVPFWSEAEGKYLLYFRVYKDKKRRIARVESDDFVNWTNPTLMEYRSGADVAPIEQLYTNQTMPYFRAPQIYVSTAARFMLGRRVITTQQAEQIHVDPHYFNDSSDAIFMTSRGGNIYDRTFMSAFIAPGIGPENWVSRTNYPGLGIIQTGPNEMSMFVNQNYGQPTACLHRYSMRLDGFASLRAEYEGGEMVTKPLKFAGDQLFINFATSAAGGVRVEIQDENGKAIPGFALDDCREIIGNEIDRQVSFAGGDLSKLNDRTVRLRFAMKDADLFSLRFGNAGK